MERNSEDKDVIRGYLLGELAENSQTQFETEFLLGGISFEELLAAEDELIDQYVSGELSDRERERFELYFLSSLERRQKLNFALALRRYVSSSGVELQSETVPAADRSSWFLPSFLFQKPILSFSLATILLLALVGAVWFVFQRGTEADWPQHEGAVVVTLTPGLVRGVGEIQRISIPGNVGTVQMRLVLEKAEHQSYGVILQSDEGRDIFSAERLEPLTTDIERVVTVSVPADLLPGGDYQVKLSGLINQSEREEIGRYYFRVVSR